MSTLIQQDSAAQEDQDFHYVVAPQLCLGLSYNPAHGLLGSGTVGEVFKAYAQELNDTHQESQLQSQPSRVFALKRFRNRPGEAHFQREQGMLKALAVAPHPNIVLCLDSWTVDGVAFMLFPLAAGDLWHFFRQTPLPLITPRYSTWFFTQLEGLSGALSYLHDWTMPHVSLHNRLPLSRIGFHHDLKPVNILLFDNDEPTGLTWKITDFGSGMVTDLSPHKRESVYNLKPSTGDPIYTAPEYVLEGRVSRPKDVWSLGCIFLECLIWALVPDRTRLDAFQEERMEAQAPDQWSRYKPMYFHQDANGVHVHPAVHRQLSALRNMCGPQPGFEEARKVVESMLTLSKLSRPSAAQIHEKFRQVRDRLLSS